MKKILWIILILIAGGLIYAVYLYNKPHRDILGENAEFAIQASELVKDFNRNEAGANAEYVDKVVEVEGEISEVNKNNIKLKAGVFCQGDFSSSMPEVGEIVKVKGRVISYDELFEEVRLDNVVLVELL